MSKSKKTPEDLLRLVQETIEAAQNEIAAERLKLDIERAELSQLRTKAKSRKLAESERAELEQYRKEAKATAILNNLLAHQQEQLQRERALFEEERRQFAHGQAGASTSPIKDEKYHGKMLGLTGKVRPSEIRDAYRVAVRQWHPDKVAQMHPDLIAFATHRLSEINDAMDYFRERYSA